MEGPIVVIGSINMDLVCRVARMPRRGETVTGVHFMTIPGGKGANQAVAAAKLVANGRKVHMIGRVGEDDFGQRLLNGLQQHGVDTRHVEITEGAASGTAIIIVDERGENSIVVAGGANALLRPRDIDRAEDLIRSASCVLLQLEIPFSTVAHAIALCKRHRVFTILDPAPAPHDARSVTRAIFQVDLFTPNQSEAETILGLRRTHRVSRKKVDDAKQIAADLLARGPKSVVLKLGQKGCLAAGASPALETSRAFKVKVADTTAAGDAFTAALAVARTEEMDQRSALRFANAAGALTCTAFGAQPALPARDALDQFLKRSSR